MKYMIMMFGGIGAATKNRSPEWVAGMHELLMKLDTELKESGECVASDSLVDPSQAKTVRAAGGRGGPAAVTGNQGVPAAARPCRRRRPPRRRR